MSLLPGFLTLTSRSIILRASKTNTSKQKPFRPFALVGFTTTTLTISHFYTSTSPLYSDSNSKSSSLLREANPIAQRKPSSQIVFLSRFEERRDDWGNWFGYFRDAGYDCYDLNIATVNEKASLDELTEELTQQIRLLSLQKPPLVFAFQKKGSDEAISQVKSKDPRMSGLVILVSSSDKKTFDKLSGLNLDKLRIIVVDENQSKGATFQEVEKWMNSQGLA